jgi:propanol-preferring alcohol dehydrogenase
MRAQELFSPSPVEQSPLRLSDLPEPRPGPGQIAVRVSACGVCRTDLHIVEGDLSAPRLPVIPGHQAVGRVCGLGDGVSGWLLDERAGVFWLHRACGKCRFCLGGEENLCPDAEFTGFHHNGGYAGVLLADAEFAVRIPDRFDDEQAAPLLCAGVIGYRSLRVAGVQPGETIGLFGFGASAHLALQAAVHWGCRVFAFTRSAEHQRHAVSLGAGWAGTAAERLPAPLDRAVLFAPSGALVPAALAHLRPGGILAINAIHMSDIPAFPYTLLYGERTVRSVANATRRDAAEFLSLAAEVPIRAAVRTYGLKEANHVLRLLKESKLEGAAVLAPD